MYFLTCVSEIRHAYSHMMLLNVILFVHTSSECCQLRSNPGSTKTAQKLRTEAYVKNAYGAFNESGGVKRSY
jgi:hypothetical protein